MGGLSLTPGTELTELQFDGFWDWFVAITDPRIHWQNQPTYLISQASYLLGGFATLIHAFVRGGRLPWLWLGIMLHGMFVEVICYISPDVDNFWHSQTPIMFFGRRFPLHIILLYCVFIYQASVAAAKLRLPKWSEPFAVGLLVVLIDLPYDIVSVKFVHWFWHDTDPNVYDRHYWVPWNSYYFHATFAASFTFWFHFLKEKCCATSSGKWFSSKNCIMELVTTIVAAILGPIGGVLLFVPLYHPLHDVFKIHSEVTFFILATVFLVLAWMGDRSQKSDDFSKAHRIRTHWSTLVLLFTLAVHYAVFWIITVFFNPENEVSTGIREQIGPCDEYVDMQTASGMVLQKRKYLCLTDYDEKYFDFHCLPNGKPPSQFAQWYTSCGTPFENRAEYIAVISIITFLGLMVFYNLHFRSFGDEVFAFKDVKVQGEGKRAAKAKKKL
ncbi:uncharacterized protein LOC126747554 [Anthonomus grandis grandis]|uniref:uncharacterized protein LOC126747554 n=1 Tax=Anthonomus grandis grandis TaxID=2921223 RepID=UPI0021668617|nr:uncharacterized protein LOC126747554 [Anthonomus grandis grandis]